MKKRKFTKEYQAYRDKYYAEKKIGNTKNNEVVFSQKEFNEAKKHGFTTKQILNSQTYLHNKTEKEAFFRKYKKIRKTYSRGETVYHEQTYFGGQREGVEGISYHYNLSGLLNDKNAMHFIISNRIREGEDREKVLADYGY